MRYTLWSRGRLLGETDLGYRRWKRRLRSGDLHPSPIGERVLPIATEPTVAIMEWGRVTRGLTCGDGPHMHPGAPGSPGANEYADWLAASARAEALDLELRDTDGCVIPTEWIDIKDTYFLTSLAEQAMEDEDVEDFSDEAFHDDERGLEFEDLELTAELDPDIDPEAMAEIERDLERWDEWLDPSEQWKCERPSGPAQDEQEETVFPQYQIHVTLLCDSSVPWKR